MEGGNGQGHIVVGSQAYAGTPTGGTLAEYYVRYAPDGLRLAYLLTGDHELAEDLVQEAFARVIAKLGHLRQRDAFHAYLRRTIVNLSKNHFRRRAVERAYLERYGASAGGQTIGPDVAPAVVDHGSMREALMRLPQRQRAALVLRYYEDLPDDQIAEILHCRAGTARSLISRGVHTLRAAEEMHAHA